MKKLLLILLCVPLIGFGQKLWDIHTMKNFISDCENRIAPSIFSSSHQKDLACQCAVFKTAFNHTQNELDKFFIDAKIKEEKGDPVQAVFKDLIYPFFLKCINVDSSIYTDNTEGWTVEIKQRFLSVCNSEEYKNYKIWSVGYDCDCILEKTMIEYPKQADYIDFILNTQINTAIFGTNQRHLIDPCVTEFAAPFISLDQMPLLGDCKDEACTQTELMKFISRNFKYPAIARDNLVEGRVILDFVVEKDGKVGRVKILRGIELNRYNEKAAEELRKKINIIFTEEEFKVWINNQNNAYNNGVKALHNECIRVIEELPLFLPAQQLGHEVPVKYTVPINCTLNR